MRIDEVKPGMLLAGIGLVTEVDLKSNTLWDNNPVLSFYSLSDCYYGPVSSTGYGEDDLQILYEIGSPEYIVTINKMIEEIKDCLNNNVTNIVELKGFMSKVE